MREGLIAVMCVAILALSVAVLFMGGTLWIQWGQVARKDALIVEYEKNKKGYDDFVQVVKERCECETSSGGRVTGRGASPVGATP